MTTNNLIQVKRKFILLIFHFIFSVMMFSQVPNIINYQAVARNSAGQALANQSIKVRLSVLKNAVSFYSETREIVTNPLGLFNVQIGSSGALSTTGNFATINWQNNADPGYVLKVELDVTNSGLFTEMGFQKLVSVPYAFASKEANHATTSDISMHADTASHAISSDFTIHADTANIATEVKNINGIPIETNDVPMPGDKLKFNGTKWINVQDTIINYGGSIINIPVIAGNPWQWVSTNTTEISLSATETVIGNFIGSFGHTGNSDIGVRISVCYQSLPSGAITSFVNDAYVIETTVFASSKTLLSASASKNLNAGNYKVGMCIKNQAITQILNANDNVNGIIEIRR